MTPEHRTVTNAALDRLPLFATDLEIAVAIVGKAKAKYWIAGVLPTLERRGFPVSDALHCGRSVEHVRQFYSRYLGVTAGFTIAKPDGEERIWVPKRERKRIEANGRQS